MGKGVVAINKLEAGIEEDTSELRWRSIGPAAGGKRRSARSWSDERYARAGCGRREGCRNAGNAAANYENLDILHCVPRVASHDVLRDIRRLVPRPFIRTRKASTPVHRAAAVTLGLVRVQIGVVEA